MSRDGLMTARVSSTRLGLLRGVSFVALSAGGMLLAPGAFAADTPTSYVGPTSNANWDTSSNWSGGTPGGTSATTVNNGTTVNTSGGDSTDTLAIGPVAGSAVNIADGTSLSVNSSLTNNGLLGVGGNYFGSALLLNGTTITGSGTLTLNGFGSSYVGGSGTVTNAGSTISGAGRFGFAEIGFNNQVGGLVDANLSGQTLTLQSSGTGVANAGTLRASAGGTLSIASSAVTQTGAGTIIATGAGSAVQLSNSSVTGGTLSGVSGGVFTTAGTNTLTNTTITAGTSYTIADSTTTYGSGTLTNHGTITVNGSYFGSELRVQGGQTLTLQGGGAVALSNFGSNYIRDADQGTGKLVNVDNTISGSGQFGYGQLALDNRVGGTVTANQTTALTLSTNSGGTTNAGVLQAVGGATLNINGQFVNNASTGLLKATGTDGMGNASTVLLTNTTVNGGTLTASGGGSVASNATTTLNNVTISPGTTYTTRDGATSYLGGTIVNNGTIAQNGSYFGSELRVAAGATTTLTGGGTVTLSNFGTNYIRDADAATGTLINVNNTIQGAGQFGNGQLGIVNQAAGTITANDATTLVLNANSKGVTNTGLIQATAGGQGQLLNSVLTQAGPTLTGTGTLLSTGAGSVFSVTNSTVNGGTLTTAGGAVMQTTGTSMLNNVKLSGGSTYTTTDGATTYLGGTIVNNGTIAQNGSYFGSDLRVAAGTTTTLTGSGTVTLSNFGSNYIRDADAGTGTLINVNNTIQGAGRLGNGQLGIVNQAAGTITANDSTTLVLNANTQGISNAGLIQAAAGGQGQLLNSVLTQTGGGTLLSTGAGSNINVTNSTVSGGTITAAAGGTMQTTGVSTLQNVNISTGTTYGTADGSFTYLSGTINNQGTISQNGSYFGSQLRVGGGQTATLTGGGTVTLSNFGNNFVLDADMGTGVLNNTNNLIQGAGQLGNGQLGIMNGGTILANDSTALNVNTNSTGLTNTGTLQATNGATLNVVGSGPLTNFAGGTLTGGTYRADAGSTLNLLSGNIPNSGVVTNAATIVLNGAGSAINTPNNTIEGSLTTVAQTGSLQVLSGRNYATTNDIGNSGQVVLGGGTFASHSLTNAATGTVTGFGTIAPTNGSALANAGTTIANGGTLTLATGISGTGTLQVNAGAVASLAGAPTANTVGTLAQNGTLATAGNNVTVSADYTNANFGSGNSFDKRAGVTGTGQILASGNVGQSISGAKVVNGTSGAPTIALGDFHTTDAAHATGGGAATFTINNTGSSGPALRGAIQTTGITSAALSGSGVAAGNFGPIAAGSSSGPYTVNVAPTGAGVLTGQSIHIANNFSNVAEQTVGITGTGYNYAQATTLPASVSVGNFHVGSGVGSGATAALTIGNVAPAGIYTEKLDGAAGAVTGGATASGSFTGLAAGGTSNAVKVGLSSATAGAVSGTATVGFSSNAAGVDSLGNSALASQTVGVTGAAYNLASSSTIGAVNFGVLHTGTGTQTQALSVTNTAPTGAFSEGLDSTFGAYTNNGGLAVTTAGSITNLAAGSTDGSSLKLSVSTATAGSISGTINVHQASNGAIDGLGNTALADQNPGVSGSVVANGTITNLAVAQINTATPVAFGNVRMGAAASQALSITNAAPVSAFSEALVASAGATTGGVTAAGGFGTPTAVPSLAAGSTDTTHLVVGLNTATAGAKSGTASVGFQSDGTAFSGGGYTSLGSQSVAVTGNVYRLASPTLNTTSLALAARVGGSASGTVSVTNTSPDVYTEGLKAGLSGAPSGFTSSGSIAVLAAGNTDATSLKVGLNTAAAGTFSGTQLVSLTSTGANTTGATDMSLAPQSVALTGKVYQTASASVTPSPVAFGIVHVGDTVAAKTLTVTNAASGALTDTLRGGFGIVSAGFTGSGTLADVAAGSSSTALSVGLNTKTAGVFTGQAALALTSHDADLADASVSAGPVSLSGTVNNYAVSGFGDAGGAGAFSGQGTAFTLDFGQVTQGAAGLLADLLAGNFAVGQSDLLAGSYKVVSGGGFSLGGFNAFAGLGAGQDETGLTAGLSTSSLGQFTEVIDLMGTGSNGSGYSGGVADTFLTLTGDVVATATQPVPEPGALAVFASGLAGLLGLGLRRHKGRGRRA